MKLSAQDKAVWRFCDEHARSHDRFPTRGDVADRFKWTVRRATEALRRLHHADVIKWGVSLPPNQCAVLKQPEAA